LIEEALVQGFIQGGIAGATIFMMFKYQLTKMDSIGKDVSEIHAIVQGCKKRRI
jgi:ABC-type thiamin/hydroxymethylpyrimidine transport system permease subunit